MQFHMCILAHSLCYLRNSHFSSHMPTVVNSSWVIVIGIPQVICHHKVVYIFRCNNMIVLITFLYWLLICLLFCFLMFDVVIGHCWYWVDEFSNPCPCGAVTPNNPVFCRQPGWHASWQRHRGAESTVPLQHRNPAHTLYRHFIIIILDGGEY